MKKIYIIAVGIILVAVVGYWVFTPFPQIAGTLVSQSDSCTNGISAEYCMKLGVSSTGTDLHISWEAENAPADSKVEVLLQYASGGTAEVISGLDVSLPPTGEISWTVPKTRIVCTAQDACGPSYRALFQAGEYTVEVRLLPANYYPTGFAHPFCPQDKSCKLIGAMTSDAFSISRPVL